METGTSGNEFSAHAGELSFFQKADAPEGRQLRIGGVVSTELEDKEEETILQKGLDFEPFLREGWFNDNHSRKTTDILGWPDYVKKFQKGDRLPDGQTAPLNGTWVEGWLIDTPDARKVYDLSIALKKSGPRRLGYSIEGNVLQRAGPGGKIVVKAAVRNIAITNAPVGNGTRLEILAKSLMRVSKGLTVGTDASPPATQGPKTGEGAGRILSTSTFSTRPDGSFGLSTEEDEEEMTKSEAIAWLRSRFNCDAATAEGTYRALHELHMNGAL